MKKNSGGSHSDTRSAQDMWSRVAVEHFAKLHHLPPNVQFPPDLDGKILFDVIRRCLVWRGFMTEQELQTLLELASDPEYRFAVSSLFERCNQLETPFTRRFNLALSVLAAMCLIGATILFVELKRSTGRHAPSPTAPIHNSKN